MGSSETATTIQKSYFDVLGICCPSEVPLIEKILKPLDGVHKVSVIVPTKTVIVEHDSLLISQDQILKALNQARLEATAQAYGTEKIINKWPNRYIVACGFFLLVSLFQGLFHPLRWLPIAAVVVGLPPIVLRSIAAIRRYTLDINTLMLIAVAGAVALRDFLEAGFIVFLFTLAEWLETSASYKANAGMSALMRMAPQKAVLAESGQVVDARDVEVNTVLAVKAGEIIPIDGIVVEGQSEVNEQSLTGESFPVTKQAHSLVWAGTLNIDGYISVKTTALAEYSAVAKMARLVEEAQNNRSKTQRLIDSCAKYYTPATVVIAGGVAVIPLILRVHNPKHWFQLALVLLVSACPCALVLSTPVATFCALLKAAKIGLLVKGGDVLEALATTRVVAFDKTGTITKGEFHVMELRPMSCQITIDTLIYWISSIESKSSHPMASALIEHARSISIEPKPGNVSEFQIYPGEGVYGEIDGKKIYIGNKRIATRAGCDSVPNAEGEGMKEAVTSGYVFSGATLIGMFTLSDSCRTGAAEAVKELKSLGVKIAMLTGDSTAAALHAQEQLGNMIDLLHAELLPEDKVRIVNDLKSKEGPTVMVGDGMNDAPALAAANVGISMGISGSAVTMETSHITLMSNDILKIPKAIRLAKKTNCKIMSNILFSVITKIAILALAIAGHPLLWAAVLADVGTCLIVILNSMMLLQTRTPKAGKRCCRSKHTSHSHAHKNKPADHCSTGVCSSAKPDSCCQVREGANSRTTSHNHCEAVLCSDNACKEPKHSHAHEDHCLREESRQSEDYVHCCEGLGRHAESTNHKHEVAAGCRMEHLGQDVHDGFGMECHSYHHSDDAHSHCGEECYGNAILVAQQLTHVDCCTGSGEENRGQDGHVHCREEHHDAHVQCATDHHQEAHAHCSEGHLNANVQCGTEHHCNATGSQQPDCRGCCTNSTCSSSTPAETTSHQHVVFIEFEGAHRNQGVHEKHCNDIIDASKQYHSHTEKKEKGCCRTEKKASGKKACCSSVQSGPETREISVCQQTEKMCKKRPCCSSYAKYSLRGREVHGCCQSYRRACSKKKVLCAAGIAHLPEIVIE